VWRKDPRIQSKGMAADGRPAVDRLSLAASAPERTAVLPLLRRRRTFIVLSGAEELRLSRRLAGLWPAGRRRRRRVGEGGCRRSAAELLFGGCRTRGCRATRASRRLEGHLRALLPRGWGGRSGRRASMRERLCRGRGRCSCQESLAGTTASKQNAASA